MTEPAGPLAGRIALVTGASRGIGAAVAKRLAAAGAHPVLLGRTVGALEEVDDAIRSAGGSATLVPLDLRSVDKIDQLGVSLYERFGHLDILVAAAGVLGALSPMGHIEPKAWQEVLDVNVTANWRLIRILDPLLRRSAAGRAIFVTCATAERLTPYWGAYAVSKAALETLVGIYAAEVAKTALKVNLIDPGATRSRLRTEAFPAEDPSTLPSPDDRAAAFLALASPDCMRHGEIVRL